MDSENIVIFLHNIFMEEKEDGKKKKNLDLKLNLEKAKCKNANSMEQ